MRFERSFIAHSSLASGKLEPHITSNKIKNTVVTAPVTANNNSNNNKNSFQEEIKSRLKSGNACYYSVHKILSSSLLSKNI
jgi:hypothetical protein